MTHWRDYVHAPDLDANCREGWEECAKKARETAGDERLVCGFMGTGIFEQTHFLMGFEDTLTGFYEHPKEMHELIEYITEYRIKYVTMLIDGLHPDAISRGDRQSSRVEAKNPALLSNRDGYLLELTGWTQGSQAS